MFNKVTMQERIEKPNVSKSDKGNKVFLKIGKEIKIKERFNYFIIALELQQGFHGISKRHLKCFFCSIQMKT